MNGFDYIVIALLVLTARKGYKNGLAAEFYRLFRMAVAIIAGTSLYSLLSGVISDLLNIDSGLSDPVLFIGVFILVWVLLKNFRRWLEAFILARTPQHIQAPGGAIAAALKSFVLIVAIVTTVSLSSWIPGHGWIAEESGTGKLVNSVLPTPES